MVSEVWVACGVCMDNVVYVVYGVCGVVSAVWVACGVCMDNVVYVVCGVYGVCVVW